MKTVILPERREVVLTAKVVLRGHRDNSRSVFIRISWSNSVVFSLGDASPIVERREHVETLGPYKPGSADGAV